MNTRARSALVLSAHAASRASSSDPGRAAGRVRSLRRRCSVGDELVDIAVGPAEVLPGRAGFAEQFDAGPSQFIDGRRQVTHGEAGDRAGTEMLLAGVTAAEYLDVAAIRELEDPETRLGVHQPEPENVLVEVRQLPGALGARAAPAKPCDLHTRQYHHQPGGTASIRYYRGDAPHAMESRAACGGSCLSVRSEPRVRACLDLPTHS